MVPLEGYPRVPPRNMARCGSIYNVHTLVHVCVYYTHIYAWVVHKYTPVCTGCVHILLFLEAYSCVVPLEGISPPQVHKCMQYDTLEEVTNRV